MFTKQDHRLIFTYDAEKLWIEPWGENALRVRATKMPEMPAEDWLYCLLKIPRRFPLRHMVQVCKWKDQGRA